MHFGIDSMRPGPEGTVNSLVHKACLELDITHIESLCNLETLIGQGEFQFIGLPLSSAAARGLADPRRRGVPGRHDAATSSAASPRHSRWRQPMM